MDHGKSQIVRTRNDPIFVIKDDINSHAAHDFSHAVQSHFD